MNGVQGSSRAVPTERRPIRVNVSTLRDPKDAQAAERPIASFPTRLVSRGDRLISRAADSADRNRRRSGNPRHQTSPIARISACRSTAAAASSPRIRSRSASVNVPSNGIDRRWIDTP